jgi:hypothetical protein
VVRMILQTSSKEQSSILRHLHLKPRARRLSLHYLIQETANKKEINNLFGRQQNISTLP